MSAVWQALLIAALLAAAMPSSAEPVSRRLDRVGFDQHLGAQLPLQARFRDEQGAPVRLGDYFRKGRPVVLVMAYYHCPNLCDSILAGVFDGLAKTGYRGGKDFELVVVGIDPGESAAAAAKKKDAEFSRYPFPGAPEHAHFLTGSQSDIGAVAKAAGFRYYYDQHLDQFVHAAGLLIATPGGVVSRYLFGVQFPPTDLRLAMVDASGNKVGSLTDKLLLLCCHYDPQTGRYGVVIMDVLRFAGGALALVLGAFMVGSIRRERRRNAGKTPGVPS